MKSTSWALYASFKGSSAARDAEREAFGDAGEITGR